VATGDEIGLMYSSHDEFGDRCSLIGVAALCDRSRMPHVALNPDRMKAEGCVLFVSRIQVGPMWPPYIYYVSSHLV